MPLNAALRAELLDLVPNGLLVTRSWLMGRGIARHAMDNLVKSGQLLSLRPGVYIRPGSRLVWQGVVSSLQRMGGDLVVGGTTALEMHGRAHYLPLSRRRAIHLHGSGPLPSWIDKLGLAETFRRHGTAWLPEPERDCEQRTVPTFTVDVPWGDGFWTVRTSTLERALFEILKDVPAGVSFEHAERLMEGLADLSPRRLDALLRRTRNVKVKRLFFWLAEQQEHAWIRRLDAGDFDLGQGKRVLVRDGRLVSRYGITVPKAMHG
ncbi:MAG: type IV toxin-antitoxin system AbiEi family antitoxin domain-containing protein [Rhodospirillaceae bacterium]|nr:type IV toxin-antitoxin system AbiEi family antitoxin domain-containing protein [Rhodospirillaceae bacterium]